VTAEQAGYDVKLQEINDLESDLAGVEADYEEARQEYRVNES